MCARGNKFSFSLTAFSATACVCQKKGVKEQCTITQVGEGRYNICLVLTIYTAGQTSQEQ